MEQDRTEIKTVADLRAAIRKAKLIYIGVQFGTSDRLVSITKKEAYHVVDGVHETWTPQDCEMGCGYFGILHKDGVLHLG